jgi:type III pantothenate kinase
MYLVIDIGNTRLKILLFDKNHLVTEKHVFDKWKWDELTDWIKKKYNGCAAILSSVVHHPEEWEIALRSIVRYLLVLDHRTPLPFTNLYKTPETLGRDRIAAVAGAMALLPDKNVLVIDAGTCIKYDFIDHAGNYHGGSILPGITMRYQALQHYTAKLPLVQKQRLDDFIGYNTETAIRTGVQIGVLGEMEGFYHRYKERYETIEIVLTGGDASFFANTLLNVPVHTVTDLIPLGLIKILLYNDLS